MTRETIHNCLQYVHRLLERNEIWHCLAYGTLLGAIRDNDILEWDYDFDIFIRSEDLFRVLAFNHEVRKDGFSFSMKRYSGKSLAINGNGIGSFWNCSLDVVWKGKKIGDIYVFFTFNDGVLRRFDLDKDVYWCPHSSFPAYFTEKTDTVMLSGTPYPGLRTPEKWLEGVYGPDWETPYRAPMQGGKPRENVTIHGDRFLPKLKEEMDWCRDQGWSPAKYAGCPEWPRYIGGAGPKGPTPRTVNNSGALWWRNLDELIIYY
jgi:hypothetical protein